MKSNVSILTNVSIITTITVFGILFMRYIFRNRIPAKLHYYIWVTLVIRVILILISIKIELRTPEDTISINRVNSLREAKMAGISSSKDISAISSNTKINFNNIVVIIKNDIMKIWAMGSGILLLYFLVCILFLILKLMTFNMRG